VPEGDVGAAGMLNIRPAPWQMQLNSQEFRAATLDLASAELLASAEFLRIQLRLRRRYFSPQQYTMPLALAMTRRLSATAGEAANSPPAS